MMIRIPCFVLLLSQPLLNLACIPPRCLLSREDIVPCEYTRRRIDRAEPNEYSIHLTRLIEDDYGSITCEARRKYQDVRPITILGTNQLKLLQSPGFSIGEEYVKTMRVEYKVQCADDELALYNITDLDLQSKADCHNQCDGRDRCQDYVQVEEPNYYRVEECGKVPSSDTTLQQIAGNFTVVFRTSEDDVVGNGFQMYVACFKPASAFLPGCFEVSEFTTGNCSGEISPSEMKRSIRSEFIEKRQTITAFFTDFFPDSGYPSHLMMAPDLANFHRQWRNSVGIDIISVDIQPKEIVTYRRQTLILRNQDNVVKSRFQLNSLQTFDSNGKITVYGRRATRRFQGPGILRIANGIGYYQLFRYDPRGVVPNEAEERELLLMSTPLLDTQRPNNGDKQRPQREASHPLFDEDDREAILAALRNQEACNAVLRAQSNITLAFYNQFHPDYVESLSSFNITCTLTSDNLMCNSDSTILPNRSMCQVDDDSPIVCDPFRNSGVQLLSTPVSSVTITAINCLGQRALEILSVN